MRRETMLGASATPEAVAALAHKLGLDQPFAARYLAWIGGALRGDLGQSYAYNSPIGAADRRAACGQRCRSRCSSMAIAAAVALSRGRLRRRAARPGAATRR